MVSIIIPVYNAEKHIKKCLDSILAQSDGRWECVVVDDGSVDDSPRICDAYMKMDSRIRVFHQKNQGVSSARNLGIREIRGEYICFVDSDDSVGPYYVEHLVKSIGDADLAVSGVLQYNEMGFAYELKPNVTHQFQLSQKAELFFLQLNEQELLFPPFGKLFKTSIIRLHNIAFPVGCDYGEDLQFVYEYLRYINKLSTIEDVDYFYWMSSGESLSQKIRQDAFEVDYKQWHIIRNLFVDKGFLSKKSMIFLYHRLFGAIYDSLFKMPAPIRYARVKKILSIPEISDMRPFLLEYPCSLWIKYMILNRRSLVFLLYLKLLRKRYEVQSGFCSN